MGTTGKLNKKSGLS